MNVDKLGDLAIKVGDAHEAMEEAFDEESAAEGALLAAVIEKVRPALPALACRMEQSYAVTAFGDVDKQREEEEPFQDLGGLLLCGDGDAVRDNPTDQRGNFRGAGLYLMADGALVTLIYRGTWSRWQGSGWGWVATKTELTPQAAAALFDLDGCVDAIEKALRSQLAGRKDRNTKAAADRATKLRALAELIR